MSLRTVRSLSEALVRLAALATLAVLADTATPGVTPALVAVTCTEMRCPASLPDRWYVRPVALGIGTPSRSHVRLNVRPVWSHSPSNAVSRRPTLGTPSTTGAVVATGAAPGPRIIGLGDVA